MPALSRSTAVLSHGCVVVGPMSECYGASNDGLELWVGALPGSKHV